MRAEGLPSPDRRKLPDLLAASAIALRRFEQYQELRKEAVDLRQDLADRKLIEWAKGILMKNSTSTKTRPFAACRSWPVPRTANWSKLPKRS